MFKSSPYEKRIEINNGKGSEKQSNRASVERQAPCHHSPSMPMIRRQLNFDENNNTIISQTIEEEHINSSRVNPHFQRNPFSDENSGPPSFFATKNVRIIFIFSL